MQETTERDRLAAEAIDLCRQIDAAEPVYLKADKNAAALLRRANAQRLRRVESILEDLSARPIRSMADIVRRVTVLLTYLQTTGPDDRGEKCPVLASLKEIRRFAGTNSTIPILGMAALVG